MLDAEALFLYPPQIKCLINDDNIGQYICRYMRYTNV